MHNPLTVGTVGRHHARTRPNAVALFDGKRSVSYGELEASVDRLARSITAAGTRKGDIVSVFLPNCIDYVVLVLAVARAGAIFSPIHPQFKSHDLVQILNRARPRLLFTTNSRIETIEAALTSSPLGHQFEIVSIDETDTTTSRILSVDSLLRSPPSELPEITDADYFSLMFTSGTTGAPKGALATHRARMLWVMNAAIQYGLSESDVYLGVMPQVHSAGLTFTLIHLYVGAEVRIMERLDAEEYFRIVERENVTSSLAVPTILQMLLETRKRSSYKHDVSTLRRMVSCGSPLPLATKREVLSDITGQLYDYYGSTESNSMSLLKPNEQLRKPASVGQPFPNVELIIVAADGREVTNGDVGEIWCKNPSAMERYLDDDEATRSVFSGAWFRTGDLGRFDTDGFLYIVGRLKDVIVSGGINIYPGEIELVMAMHPAVADCAVVGVPDNKWGESVKCFASLHDGYTLNIDEAQRHCSCYLADYKKPRYLEIVDDLPKNANGKTIKKALL